MSTEKDAVRDFWDEASCGEKLYLEGADPEGFRKQAAARYALEPYIVPFADFSSTRGKRVLEIGVGLGADHQRFAEAGAVLSGLDLTPRAVDFTRRRLAAFGLSSDLQVGDAEQLPFEDETFDRVYSWGVIHHSPDTPAAVREICRVMRPGGTAAVMVYHTHSLVGLMLWLRYALARARPWISLSTIYASYLESPGTKAYSIREGHALFSQFTDVTVRTQLTHGDLLSSQAGQRHEGLVIRIMRVMWPRWFFTRFCKRSGLFMLINATKPR